MTLGRYGDRSYEQGVNASIQCIHVHVQTLIPPFILLVQVLTGLDCVKSIVVYLLVSEGVHVANDLGGHLASVSGAILESSLNNGHDQSEGGSINEVDKLGVQQCLEAGLGLFGWICQRVQENRGDG